MPVIQVSPFSLDLTPRLFVKSAAIATFIAHEVKASQWTEENEQARVQAYNVKSQTLPAEVGKQVHQSPGKSSFHRLLDLIPRQQNMINLFHAAGDIPKKLDAKQEFDLKFNDIAANAARLAPRVLHTLASGGHHCWTSLVVLEQINMSEGVGFLMNRARDYGQTEIIVVGLTIYAVLGLSSDALVRACEPCAGLSKGARTMSQFNDGSSAARAGYSAVLVTRPRNRRQAGTGQRLAGYRTRRIRCIDRQKRVGKKYVSACPYAGQQAAHLRP